MPIIPKFLNNSRRDMKVARRAGDEAMSDRWLEQLIIQKPQWMGILSLAEASGYICSGLDDEDERRCA